MSAGKEAPVDRDISLSSRMQVPWFWAGTAALAVILIASGVAAVVHGGGQIFEYVQLAAAIVCAGSFFRWAILRDRAKVTK
jgi:hypothetical protein